MTDCYLCGAKHLRRPINYLDVSYGFLATYQDIEEMIPICRRCKKRNLSSVTIDPKTGKVIRYVYKSFD